MDVNDFLPHEGLYFFYRKDNSYAVVTPDSEMGEDLLWAIEFVKQEAEREAERATATTRELQELREVKSD